MEAGNTTYSHIDELDEQIALFPLAGALLLPAGNMPLNIFEPRYLAMFDDALKGNRLIGVIQPRFDLEEALMKTDEQQAPLCEVGCVGRITAHQESGEGRMMINLAGITRFQLLEEVANNNGYRRAKVDYYPGDLQDDTSEIDAVDREGLLQTFKQFLEANDMDADWDGVREAGNQTLVNTLSMMSPFGPAEKQALLEAPDLKTRAETLVAITEIMLARAAGDATSTLQ
ncbi:MAG: LON peptidase substrate-binding domain-containing protein [Rhizobiaceae bacterium]